MLWKGNRSCQKERKEDLPCQISGWRVLKGRESECWIRRELMVGSENESERIEKEQRRWIEWSLGERGRLSEEELIFVQMISHLFEENEKE